MSNLAEKRQRRPWRKYIHVHAHIFEYLFLSPTYINHITGNYNHLHKICASVWEKTIVAMNTEESDGNFLLKADSAAYDLHSHVSDDWDNTCVAGTKL